MKIYKINNIVQENGVLDYKGFDIDLFVIGKVLYPHNLHVDNFAYITTTEEIIMTHPDVTQIGQDEFDAFREAIKVEPGKSELDELKEKMQLQEEALVELAEMLSGVLG